MAYFLEQLSRKLRGFFFQEVVFSLDEDIKQRIEDNVLVRQLALIGGSSSGSKVYKDKQWK